ncbi:transcription factor TFIIIB component B'' homolog isoform X2 [Puntigrus tetrazona]|uniref:transcription factor TFIIIB component B'' homolog isoform X2 n=1 Tax=Puntigrus tetrazona TaxID=1606681 RepID=UPI001C89789F|nr:transcription factor TFIIIB component B'' homolog isoform X2 [Puntigrus tetrazona]
MRRSRISIKPNVRPGGRSVGTTAEDKSSQGSTAVGDTQQKLPSASQSQLEVKESAVATGDGNVPHSPLEKASLNINDGAPSSVSTPATTVIQRRGRISATPNLARPKARSAPSSTGNTVSLPSEPSNGSSPFQAAKPRIPVAISRDDSQNNTFSDATTAANCPPSSPCLPSTSGCPASVSTTQSQQEPCRTPQKIPSEDFVPQEGATPVSCTHSPYVKLSRVDGPDSPLRNKFFSDKQQVLRALKLKELMKLERKKVRMETKSRRHKREHCNEPDRDKMTLGDFIYYLPESNPMKSSLSTEEAQSETTAPPTPTVQKTVAEADDEEDDADEDMLVPKVKVAEDGSLILDEESLTVHVQRTSDTVIESANPLFERGSTTTYTSFRKKYYVKSWSVRETDMFFLAISMVGTDFSMMAQLLTHRSRAEIKNKFRREERINSWRVDKAFRNKRPYDSELFSFLLKRVLLKDKQKGRSIKLVVKTSKAKKSKGGAKSKQLEVKDSINDNEDDELCSMDLEKENEDSSNMNETDVPSSTSKKRKRSKYNEPKVSSCEKACKQRKKNKTLKKGKRLMGAEDGNLVCAGSDLLDADSEDQSRMTVSKKKCKQSKKELIEESTDGETDELNEASAIKTKKRKRSKKCKKEEKEVAKCKRKTKIKPSQEGSTGSELGADCSDVSLTDHSAEDDQGEKLYPERATEEISQSSSKHSKRPNLAKRKAKKCSEPEATIEIEDTAEERQDKCCIKAENELRIIRLAEKQLQSQPVVVLERTPPRLKDSHSSSENQEQPPSSQSLQRSPGRQMRAEKVKRNLTASSDGNEVSTAGPGIKDQGLKLIPESSTKEILQSSSKHSPEQQSRAEKVQHNQTASEGDQIDQCHTGLHPSPEDMSSTAIMNQLGIQDSKEMEADQYVEEDLNVNNLEFLTPSEVNGQTLKRPVVLVSRDEVKHYVKSQAQTTAEESTTSESPQDTAPARGHHGDNRDDLDEHGSSSGVLEESVSQDQDVKETKNQLNIDEKKRFSKPQPHLSLAAQSICRPLNENTSSFKHDSVQLQCRSPVEVQAKIALSECLVEEHRDHPEEELTCSVTPEVSSPQDLKDDEAQTSEDDVPYLTSIVSRTEDQETVLCLEKPLVPDTTSSDKENENEDKMTDQEEQDSEVFESEVTDTVIEEPQTELKRIIPVSCSADGSSVYAQDRSVPERLSQFKKTPINLKGASLVMINSQQTSKTNEDLAEKSHHKSPVKAKNSDLDHDNEKISREDKLLSSEENLQEYKQNENLLSSVPLHDLKQTLAPEVLVDSTGKGNKEQNDQVLSDASSKHSPVSSFSDDPNKSASTLCDVDIEFSEPAAEDVQIPDEQDLKNQDDTEEPSEAFEECSASLNENAKSEISDSAGMDTAVTGKHSEGEPTFILTLYEIPSSQLYHEATFGRQDTAPYELQPAQVQTPLLFSSSARSHSFTLETSSASLNMASEETSNLCKSSSCKVEDDSLDPLSKEAADDASTQLICSQESSRDDVNSLISSPGMFSCNSATLDEMLTESSETKAPTHRRCKVKVKPKLKPYVKAGPSKNGQFDVAPSLSKFQATAQTEVESSQKISAQEAVDPESHSNLESSERGACPGPDSVISTAIVPVPEHESHLKCEHPLRKELQRNEDYVVDSPVHSTFIKESEGINRAECQSISHTMLADAFVLPSGEMKDVFNKEQEDPHDSDLLIPDGLAVCLTESEKALPPVIDQEEKVEHISKRPDTCREASCVSSLSASQERTMSIEPLIKEEFIKEEQETEQEDFSDIPKEELDKEHAGIASPSQCQQLIPFSTVKPTACTELHPVEPKIEDASHVVLPEISVPVSAEKENSDHMARGSSVQSSLQMGEENQQVVTAEADQEMHSHEGVSHMLLTDMLIPVCEKMEEDLNKERTTARGKSPHGKDRSQVREDPDTVDLFCQASQSSDVGQLASPKRNRPTRGKGELLVKMAFPKRKTGDSPKSGEQSQTIPLSESTQCNAETCADLLPTEEREEASEGGSHNVPSDILVPVLDETSECSLHKEALSAGLQEDAIKVETSTDIDSPTDTETEDNTSVAVECKPPCCRRGTVHPVPELSKRKDGPSEDDLCQPSSTRTSLATPQQSLDPQTVEWSLKSDMLPVDSDEMENWCEGVSHMLLSDTLVPVSEETGENSTDLKVFVLSSPHKDKQITLSLTKSEETPSETSSDVHQLDSTSDMTKTNESLPASQTKKSPARSTFQMTLRSPERCLKYQPHVLKSIQAAPTTPQRTSKAKEPVQTPTRLQTGEISSACWVQLERLSVGEVCSAQSVLQPKHHSTPVTVKPTSRENEMALHGSRSSGLESPMPPGYSPRVVLHRIPLTTDENISVPVSSPARVCTTPSRTRADHPNNPPVSSLKAEKNPEQVSHFLLDDIFTEVVDAD